MSGRDKVVKASKLEMDLFRKVDVNKKSCHGRWPRTCCEVITTKWLDKNKGDESKSNCRGKQVGREVCARCQAGPEPHRTALLQHERDHTSMHPRGDQSSSRFLEGTWKGEMKDAYAIVVEPQWHSRPGAELGM